MSETPSRDLLPADHVRLLHLDGRRGVTAIAQRGHEWLERATEAAHRRSERANAEFTQRADEQLARAAAADRAVSGATLILPAKRLRFIAVGDAVAMAGDGLTWGHA